MKEGKGLRGDEEFKEGGKLTGSPGTLLETVVWALFVLARTAEWRGEGPTRRCLQLVGVVAPRLMEGKEKTHYLQKCTMIVIAHLLIGVQGLLP